MCFADYPEDEDDEEEFPDYLVDEADFHQYAVDREGLSAGGGGGAVNPLSAEARAALEAQFDRTLEEYEDEEIGYLEEVRYTIYTYRIGWIYIYIYDLYIIPISNITTIIEE